jgi:hypothetical protein
VCCTAGVSSLLVYITRSGNRSSGGLCVVKDEVHTRAEGQQNAFFYLSIFFGEGGMDDGAMFV